MDKLMLLSFHFMMMGYIQILLEVWISLFDGHSILLK